MMTHNLPVRIEEFSIRADIAMDASVVVPTVRGTWKLKYGKHAYYFMNFRTSRGFRVDIDHLDIIRPGLAGFAKAKSLHGKAPSMRRCFAREYHYGFNLLEQVMLMTVPHAVTGLGDGLFIINLWAYCGYLVVDCRAKTVTYHTTDDNDSDHVLGSQQWFDSQTNELYAMSYSLSDSFARIEDPHRSVSSRIFRHTIGKAGTQTVWAGEMSDYMHDIIVNKNRQYCVACELGMYLDAHGNIIPSKVKVIDLKNGTEWSLDRFIVAAHACFDPEDPNVVYFSNHNFQFEHNNILKLLKKGSYSIVFRGPASVFKYRLTPEGPQELGVFTHPDFFRLTNMHAFTHRGRNVIAAMGFPDEIFLIDADNMDFIRKLVVADPCSMKHGYSNAKALIGTISPSFDGEKLFVHTTKSFHIVDIASGQSSCIRDHFFSHSCFNHMLTSNDTTW